MLISFPSSSACEGPLMLQGEGICIESLVETIGPLYVHSTTCNRGGLGISPSSVGGGTGQKTEHCQENVFRTPRQSLLRDQIFSSISKGFHLSPRGEIIG